ncbi:MAG: hypothetical protein GKS00_08190 [Alphaproteobacteria bacterium]|nr:hypothetical protein [Alphaproteobacteria bacterium]
MTTRDRSDDIQAIETLIARQFRSISWSADKISDWETFAGDFVTDAPLYAAARPAKRQLLPAFIERMKTAARTNLESFEQSVGGTKIHVFGNVAVAFGVCCNIENRERETQGVEAFLLIKENGTWRIAAQAWDMEDEALKVPDYLLHGTQNPDR